MSDEQFREMAARAIREYSRRAPDEQVLERLLESSSTCPGAVDEDALYDALAGVLEEFEEQAGRRLNRCFYLATAPRFFPVIVRQLGKPRPREARGRRGAGRDREAVRHLARRGRAAQPRAAVGLHERQVFRIDHYLGKETVQNLLAFRFANGMFEPWWNRNFIDHVQITAAEDVGVGSRAEYYDTVGALRDLIQNHMLQLLCHVAMEPPIDFSAERGAQREGQGAARHPHADARGDPQDRRPRPVRAPAPSGGEPVAGYLAGGGRAARTRTPRPTPRCASRSTTGAGPACRSTCGPASGSARKVTEIAVMLKPVPHLGFSQEGSVGVRPELAGPDDPAQRGRVAVAGGEDPRDADADPAR